MGKKGVEKTVAVPKGKGSPGAPGPRIFSPGTQFHRAVNCLFISEHTKMDLGSVLCDYGSVLLCMRYLKIPQVCKS